MSMSKTITLLRATGTFVGHLLTAVIGAGIIGHDDHSHNDQQTLMLVTR
jgi:hypothetical protein